MEDYRKYLKPEVITKLANMDLRARLVVEGFRNNKFPPISTNFDQFQTTNNLIWRCKMLKIYGAEMSPNVNKVRFAANAIGLPFEFKPVNLMAGEQKSPEFLKVNPLGRVPAIDDNGFKLAESNAIMKTKIVAMPSHAFRIRCFHDATKILQNVIIRRGCISHARGQTPPVHPGS